MAAATAIQPRYIRIRKGYGYHIFEPDQQCAACGTFYGNYGQACCPVTTCKLCEAPQCMGNGMGNGQCSICFSGLLPGWSGSEGTCGYKNCGKPAVARGRGRKYVCHAHAVHQKLLDTKCQRLIGWALFPQIEVPVDMDAPDHSCLNCGKRNICDRSEECQIFCSSECEREDSESREQEETEGSIP